MGTCSRYISSKREREKKKYKIVLFALGLCAEEVQCRYHYNCDRSLQMTWIQVHAFFDNLIAIVSQGVKCAYNIIIWRRKLQYFLRETAYTINHVYSSSIFVAAATALGFFSRKKYATYVTVDNKTCHAWFPTQNFPNAICSWKYDFDGGNTYMFTDA